MRVYDSMEIVPFSDEHVDAAAELLAARHAQHREAEPRLPDDVDCRAQAPIGPRLHQTGYLQFLSFAAGNSLLPLSPHVIRDMICVALDELFLIVGAPNSSPTVG